MRCPNWIMETGRETKSRTNHGVRRKRIAALLVAVVMILLYGCGSDDGNIKQSEPNQEPLADSPSLEEAEEQTEGIETSLSFAEQYYESLLSYSGFADEHLEIKLRTTQDHSASTVCLVPENANIGVIFKDIADFDDNGVEDLIVVSLEDWGETVCLDQAVYFFDADGNHTQTSGSNVTPITGDCSYCFYMVGNYFVKIVKKDNSGDWIDGLRYEVIEDNAHMHDDEIHIMTYDLDAPDNGQYHGEILYVHKDFRSPNSVCYTINDIDGYYSVYSRGFIMSSVKEKRLESEEKGCDYINALLCELLDGKVGQIKPTSWENRWETGFLPSDALPESYTVLRITTSPSYKTGENTTESEAVIEAEYVDSR